MAYTNTSHQIKNGFVSVYRAWNGTLSAKATTSRNSLLKSRLTYPSTWAAGSHAKPSSTAKNPAIKFPDASGMHTRLANGAATEKTPK